MNALPSFCSVALLLTAATNAFASEPYTVTVVSVENGDVLMVNHEGKAESIRIYGVDCPEPGQGFAAEAQKQVTEKVAGKSVRVEPLIQDNQGKTVAHVILEGESSLGESLIATGLAWWDKPNTPEDRKLRGLNAKAIIARVGLWSGPAPLSPWDYRRSHGLPEVVYTLTPPEKPQEDTPPAEAPVPTLKAKGNASASAPPSVPVPGLNLGVNQDYGQLMMRHQPRLARGANGEVLGMTASNVAAIPFATQLGFQEGDIATAVNGVPLRNPAEILGLIDRFKNTKTFKVDIIRGGNPTTITIDAP